MYPSVRLHTPKQPTHAKSYQVSRHHAVQQNTLLPGPRLRPSVSTLSASPRLIYFRPPYDTEPDWAQLPSASPEE